MSLQFPYFCPNFVFSTRVALFFPQSILNFQVPIFCIFRCRSRFLYFQMPIFLIERGNYWIFQGSKTSIQVLCTIFRFLQALSYLTKCTMLKSLKCTSFPFHWLFSIISETLIAFSHYYFKSETTVKICHRNWEIRA